MTVLTVPDKSRTANAVMLSPLAEAWMVPKLLIVLTEALASIRMPPAAAVGLMVPARSTPEATELLTLDSMKSSLRISGATAPAVMWIAVELAS